MRPLVALLVFLVSSSAFSATLAWTGAGGNELWSNAANWSPAGVPVSGDSLMFPEAVANATMVNDLAAGTSFEHFTFGRRQYTLSGSSFGLTNGISRVIFEVPPVRIDADVTFDGSQTLSGTLVFGGTVTVNGALLASNLDVEGPLNGSGSIAFSKGAFRHGGNFDGTIRGGVDAELHGVFANADIIPTLYLRGDATVRSAVIYTLWPGTDAQPIGRFETGSLRYERNSFGFPFQIDLAARASDRIVVHGSVSISESCWLVPVIRADAPVPGQVFVVIENDGNDAISGEFFRAPEGTILRANDCTVIVSYVGGDGNDFTLTVVSTARTWTGNGTNGNWSNPQNWSPAGAPVAGQSLIFPHTVELSKRHGVNDLAPGTQFEQLRFDDNYFMTGNGIAITDGLTAGSPIDFPVTFNGDQSVIYGLFRRPVTAIGNITFESRTIFEDVLNGTGTLIFDRPVAIFKAGGSFTGTVDAAIVTIGASMPNTSFSIEDHTAGSGTIGNLWTAQLSPGLPDVSAQIGTLTMSSLTIGGCCHAGFIVELAGEASDRVIVTGPVRVAGFFHASLLGAIHPGHTYLLIDNDGNDPISGTFSGGPEGQEFAVRGYRLKISYVGGDGNDLTVTVLGEETAVVLQQSMTASPYGGDVTLTATATSNSGPAIGTVTFFDGATVLGEADLAGGVATLTRGIGEVGPHSLVAKLDAAGIFLDDESPAIAHTVERAPVALDATSADDILHVVVAGPANLTGTVTITEGAANLGIATAVAQPATFDLSALPSGTHTIGIAYSGDVHYLPASTNVNVVISPPFVDVGDAAADEGDDGAHVFEIDVTLSKPSVDPVTVEWYTFDGTARAGEDYTAAGGVLTFAPGETEKSVSVVVEGDDTPEDHETFSVAVHGGTNVVIRDNTGDVTIWTDDELFATYFDLEYAPGQALTLRIPSVGDGPHPLILGIESEYWSSIDRFGRTTMREAKRGYAVATLTFRRAGTAPFPAQLDDVRNALAWLRANAASYAIDPERIGVWGIGTGGHLAALLGTTGNGVDAVVTWYAPADLTATDGCGTLAADVATLLGCADCDAAARDASPVTHADADDPPFLIMHGGDDCVVPRAHAEALASALGDKATLVINPSAKHGGAIWDHGWATAPVDAFFDQWLRGIALRRRASR